MNNRPLRLARWMVIGFAVIQLALILIGIAMFSDFVRQNMDQFTPNAFWSSAQTQSGLQSLGWPVEAVAWIDLGMDIIQFTISYFLGFLLLRQQPPDWFGLLLALIFFMVGGSSGEALMPVTNVIPVLDFLYNTIIAAVSWQFFFMCFFLFPTGRPVPSWTRWLILAWFMFMILTVSFPAFNLRPIAIGLAFFFVFSAIGSQVYRYWKYSTAVQRQQTRWVVYALVVVAATAAAVSFFAWDSPSAENIGRNLVVAMLASITLSLTTIMIMVSIVIAIIRYQLYDIDVIIRKTLVYGALTALLALVFFGGVTVLQSLFQAVSGQQSAVSIVISTLAIAALFNPLRRRIQNGIDRRFYRRKYNAEQALAKFAEMARNVTEIEKLSAEMLAVVQDTMQPERVSLWLPKRDKP